MGLIGGTQRGPSGPDSALASQLEQAYNASQAPPPPIVPIGVEPQSAEAPIDPAARIPVQDRVGGFGTVPASQLQEALGSGNFTLATAEQLAASKEREYYNTPLQLAATAAEGSVRGASLGLYDPLMREVAGPEFTAESASRKRVSPLLSGASEVAGMVATLIASGGTASAAGGAGALARGGQMAARVVSAPIRGLMALGEGTEALAARGLAGLAEGGIAGRTAAGVIPGIARQGVEGAVIGAGHYFSEAALGNHKMRAEELLAAAGGGALIGSVLGGGLGLLGAGGREVVRYGKRALAGGGEEGASLGTMLVGKGKTALTDISEGTQGLIDANQEFLGKKAVELGIRGLGPTKRVNKVIAAMAPEQRATLPDLLFKEIPAEMEKRIGHVTDSDAAITSLLERKGTQIGGLAAEGDAAAVAAGVKKATNLAAAIDEMRDEVLGKLQTVATRGDRAFIKEEINALEKQFAHIDEAGEIVPGTAKATLKEARDERVSFRGKAREWDSGLVKNTDRAHALDQMGAIIEKHVEKGVRQFGGPELFSRYKQTKNEWGALRDLKKASTEGVSKYTTNRFGGLSEQMLGHAAGIVGAAVGGIPGFVIGEGVGRGAAWLEKHYGSQYAAEVAHMLSKGSSIADVANMTQSEIRRGVAEFVGGGVGSQIAPIAKAGYGKIKEVSAPAMVAATRTAKASIRTAGRVGAAMGTAAKIETIKGLNPAQFQSIRHDIQKRHEDPTLIVTSVLSTGLQHSHPTIAQSLSQRATVANEFLYSKLPLQATRPSMSGPVLVPPTKEQMREFERYVRAIDDPLSLLDDLRNGNVSPQTVMAIKTVYPQMYGDIEAHVRVAVAGKKNLPYSKKMSLGLLFGSPVDPTLTTEYLQAMSLASASAMPQRGSKSSLGPTFPRISASKVKPPPSRMTQAEKIGSS